MDIRMFRGSRASWGLMEYLHRLTKCYMLLKKANWLQVEDSVLGILDAHIAHIATLIPGQV